MKKLLAACVLAAAVAAPAMADESVTVYQSNLRGSEVLDTHDNSIGTIDYTTLVNGRQAAVITVDSNLGLTDIALPMKALQPMGNGEYAVPASANQLALLPVYVPGQPYALPRIG